MPSAETSATGDWRTLEPHVRKFLDQFGGSVKAKTQHLVISDLVHLQMDARYAV